MMTKHTALRSFLFAEKNELAAEMSRQREHIEYLQEQLAEMQQEMNQLPLDETIEEQTYQELAGECEMSGVVLPDILLADDENDNGEEEISHDVLVANRAA